MKRYKTVAAYLVLILTIGVFTWYVRSHPAVIEQLKTTNVGTIAAVLALYGAMTVVLAFLYAHLLKLCGVNIEAKENALLTMYSSVVNFFGPLQSGPGFRMVYVKKRFGVRMVSYLGTNIIYYLFFAVISGLFLISGLIGPWLTVGLFLAWAVAVYLMLPKLTKIKRVGRLLESVPLRSLGIICVLTFVQLMIVALIYFVELSSLRGDVSFSQAMVYAGAANFSLFVSLTPGALGFRETFLLFTQRLHGIDSTTIVTANILDRGLYVVFLGILFAIILALHGRQQLDRFKKLK